MMNRTHRPRRSRHALGSAVLLASAFVLFQSQTASAQSGLALTTAARAMAAHQKATQDETVRKKAKAENDQLDPSAATTEASLQSVQSAKPAKNPSGGKEHIDIGGSGNTNQIAKWIDDAGNLGNTVAPIFETAGGNVGIGTTGPTDKLYVVGGITTSGSVGGLSLAPRNGSGAIHEWYNPSGTDVRLFNTATGSDVMTIQNGGNVGIGTTNPTSKLYVNGDITASGAINARYQDVAEWVPASHAITAGSVVVLDTVQSNHVLPSSRAYDTRVAGVVSANPGVILGEGGAGKVMVATTGRVRVKVDAAGGPIRVGDLLVTSDKEGIAMRSQPLDLGGTAIHRPGTLIGKALEPLEKGVGEILVLLSLQ
ncbi:MAG TPA: hypothetical protein VGL29_23145 [Blastocatellia bacterium]